MSNSYEAAARAVALSQSNKVYADLLAGGVNKWDAAESAARIYDVEYRHELQDIYGEDFREDDYEPDPDPRGGRMTFVDGSRITPGTEKCMCDSAAPRPDGRSRDCEFPCWQRIGLTSAPCCPDCAPLGES